MLIKIVCSFCGKEAEKEVKVPTVCSKACRMEKLRLGRINSSKAKKEQKLNGESNTTEQPTANGTTGSPVSTENTDIGRQDGAGENPLDASPQPTENPTGI
jgi:Fe-S-cluster-containing dehydrogenase component